MVGASSPALAAAVSNAGAFGSVAVGAMKPEDIAPMVAEVRKLTAKPFGINLFVVRPEAVDKAAVAFAIEQLKPWREKFGLPPQETPANFFADFDTQLEAVIAERPAVASFTFGCLTDNEVERLHAANIYVIGTATTIDEAREWQQVDADALCLQGFEAGGHRGSFTPEAQREPVPISDLLAQARDTVTLPLIAAGGIMDGTGIKAALKAGGAAAQLGTAFLLCPESVTSAPWRAAVKAAQGDVTRLTRAFSGRYARGIENDFMREMREIESRLPAYPVQNVLTGELRAACAKAGSADCLSLWAGTGFEKIREMPAAVLVKTLWQEACA